MSFWAFLRCSRRSSLRGGRGGCVDAVLRGGCCLLAYVSPPRPIEVKKLMAKRVFFGLSRGRSPSNARASILGERGGREGGKQTGSMLQSVLQQGQGSTYGSLSLSFNLGMPINSAISWNKILTKIRLQGRYL